MNRSQAQNKLRKLQLIVWARSNWGKISALLKYSESVHEFLISLNQIGGALVSLPEAEYLLSLSLKDMSPYFGDDYLLKPLHEEMKECTKIIQTPAKVKAKKKGTSLLD